MNLLHAEGSWSLRHGGNATGIPPVLVWITEAGLFIPASMFGLVAQFENLTPDPPAAPVPGK